MRVSGNRLRSARLSVDKMRGDLLEVGRLLKAVEGEPEAVAWVKASDRWKALMMLSGKNESKDG